MTNILRNIKERVLYLSENVEVSKQKFFKKIDITYGNFTGEKKKRPLNSDAIANILRNYPQTNPEWLLTGNGEMLKGEKHEITPITQSEKEQYEDTIRLLKSVIKDKEEIIKNKDEIISLLKESKKDGLELLPVSMVAEDESKEYSKTTPIIGGIEQNQRTKPLKST